MKQRIQGIFIGFLFAILLFGGVVAAKPATTWKNIQVAFGSYKIYVNGVLFEAKDNNGGVLEPFSYDGWIYAPFEHIARALGKSVRWDGNTHSLYIEDRTAANATKAVKLSSLNQRDSHKPTTFKTGYETTGRDNTDSLHNDVLWWGRGSGYSGVDTSWIEYSLDGQYLRLEGTIYLDYDTRITNSSGKIKIWGDGKLIYESPLMTKNVDPQKVNINLSNIKILRIGAEVDLVQSQREITIGLSEATLYQ
jgi:hypothetical protein